MATKKLTRMPYTPKAIKKTFTNQTIRLSTVDNNRLKRAALKRKMSFNAWATQTLIDAAEVVLNPVTLAKPPQGVQDLNGN